MAEDADLPIAELEGRLLYAVIVAGKSAKFADAVTAKLWSYCREGESPFEMVRRHILNGILRQEMPLGTLLFKCRTGNYKKTEKCFRALVHANLDLRTCGPADLEKIHGIGPKTSRFFIMWIRPNERYAALDVHILRWLRARGYDAPRTTPPSGRKYAELEAAFIAEADAMGKTPRELDYEIWERASGQPQESSGYSEPAQLEAAA